MRKVALLVGSVSLGILTVIGCAESESSAINDNHSSAVEAEDMVSWMKKFQEDQTIIALSKDSRGLDPRTQRLSSEQCRIILADYDAVLEKAPMPPFKSEEFKRYLEESREAYSLACNGDTGLALDSQIKDALRTQNDWAHAFREEFPQAKQNIVYLTNFPF